MPVEHFPQSHSLQQAIDDRHRSDARRDDRFTVSGIGSLTIGQILRSTSLRLRLDVMFFSVHELVPIKCGDSVFDTQEIGFGKCPV